MTRLPITPRLILTFLTAAIITAGVPMLPAVIWSLIR